MRAEGQVCAEARTCEMHGVQGTTVKSGPGFPVVLSTFVAHTPSLFILDIFLWPIVSVTPPLLRALWTRERLCTGECPKEKHNDKHFAVL